MLQRGCTNTDDGACSLTVCVMEKIQVPPSSEMEIMATVQRQSCNGPWLLEGILKGRLPVVVARALFEPKAGCVPVRPVNTRSEPITIYHNTILAMLENTENLRSQGAVIASAGQGEVPKEKKVLLDIVEKNGADLTGNQKDKFYTLLINYSSIFATTDLELGKTDKPRHQIETGNATPICQAARCICPVRREEVCGLLKQMQEKDVIQQSSSPLASPIVLVKKKRWNHKILCGLPQNQQCYKERSISPPQN